MDKLSELKAAAMAATPGPWFVHEKPCEDGNYGIDTSDNEWTAEAVVWWGFARESIWRRRMPVSSPQLTLLQFSPCWQSWKRRPGRQVYRARAGAFPR